MNPAKKPLNGVERNRNYRKKIRANAELCAAYKAKTGSGNVQVERKF